MKDTKPLTKEEIDDLERIAVKNVSDLCDRHEALKEEMKLYKLNTPHTKDGKPIFIGIKIWTEDPDMNQFDPDRFTEQTVCSICGETFEEYEGDYTISCDDLECGNLETFSTREAIEAAMASCEVEPDDD